MRSLKGAVRALRRQRHSFRKPGSPLFHKVTQGSSVGAVSSISEGKARVVLLHAEIRKLDRTLYGILIDPLPD